MQYYDITVAANGRQDVQAPGTFFYYLNGNAGGADNTITLTLGMGGTKVVLKPGQSVRLPDGAKEISDWVIGNYANSATILGQVLIGRGDFKDTNVVGTVQVVDGAQARTLANQAFFAAIGSGAGASQYAECQLWNPAGRTVSLVVESLELSCAVSTSVNLWMGAVALGSVQSNPASKLSGGANSGAQSRVSSPTTPDTAGATQLYGCQLGANLPYQKVFKEPVVLKPGYGLFALNNTTNQTLNFGVEFFEQAL